MKSFIQKRYKAFDNREMHVGTKRMGMNNLMVQLFE